MEYIYLIIIGLVIFIVVLYELLKKDGNKNNETVDWVKDWEKRVELKESDYNYEDLLTDPRWISKREKILRRDRHQCQWCHRTDHLQVHHKVYNSIGGKMVAPWDYPDKVLMTLCDDCHKKYHQKYRVPTYARNKWEHYK